MGATLQSRVCNAAHSSLSNKLATTKGRRNALYSFSTLPRTTVSRNTAVRRKPVASIAERNGSTPAAANGCGPLDAVELQMPGQGVDQVNMVYKFGGSSVATAERMWEVAQIVCSFPENLPCVVLSAMGKTTNMLLQAGEEALKTPPGSISSLAPLR